MADENSVGQRRQPLWPIGAAIAIVAVLVIGAVLLVNGGDDGPGPAARFEEPVGDGPAPRVGDHWHAAYGVWLCDAFADPLSDLEGDRTGIHTHDDGVIHVHPFIEEVAGPNATLSRFAQEVGLDLDDGSFALPSDDKFVDGDDCDGSEAVVQVLEWRSAKSPGDPVVHTSDLRDIRLRDGAAYTIAFMTRDTEPGDLVPASAPDLEELGSIDSADGGS